MLFPSYLEFWTMGKVLKPMILSVIHHHQNHFDSTYSNHVSLSYLQEEYGSGAPVFYRVTVHELLQVGAVWIH
jgi:hypothetical protein